MPFHSGYGEFFLETLQLEHKGEIPRLLMAKRRNDIEQILSQLDRLVDVSSDEETWFALRRGLMSKHGIAVGKAAKIAAQLEWKEGIPDMLKAYDRLSNNGANVDPGCILLF